MAPRARRPKRKQSNARQTAFTRFMFVVAVFVIWMCGISVRLVHLQINQHEELSDRAERQRRDVKRTKLPRGTIFDRNGRALAMSITVKNLVADPAVITDQKAAARAVAGGLGLKESDVLKKLTRAASEGKRYVVLAKGVDAETAIRFDRAINDMKEPPAGLQWADEQQRSYPYGTLAAHVVGFSNAEGVGQAGIEQSQNDVLYGATVKRMQERDRLGRVYEETVSENNDPKDVMLTISTSIQYHTEEALEKAVTQANARSGMAIVIDHRTGEVLAMANYPTFDPNKLGKVSQEHLKNEAIQNIYSPGSVFKLLTYGSALERGLITPDGTIDSGNGTIEVAKHRFKDSHPIGQASYSKALAVSSNVCAIKTGLKVGKDGFYQTMRTMGFGRPTGIELPAETGGIVRSPERWYGDSLASMSIGYEVGVSALQMATAFATVANDGVRVKPRIIKEVRKPGGTAAISRTVPEAEQLLKKETAQGLKTMLREVVVSGTGKAARLNGYSSAGKTGTAWKFDEKLKRVNSAKYISSFIGFAPAEDPKITIAVVIDEPTSGGRNGGQVAAPVFREVAERVLAEMEVAPAGSPEVLEAFTAEVPEETVGNGEPASTDSLLKSQPGEAEPHTSSKPSPGAIKPEALPERKRLAPQRAIKPDERSRERFEPSGKAPRKEPAPLAANRQRAGQVNRRT
jgi:cell division protein FtsI (penicillin-binding protein 3)